MMVNFLRSILFTGVLLTSSTHAASNASITGTATQSVLASISIVSTSNLVFPAGAQGDPAAIVPPGAVENANNASFTVTGQANATFTITLPATSINMVNGAATIAVSSFTSFPSATSTLSATGTKLVLVGATRAALTASQLAGNYSGSFTITVNY